MCPASRSISLETAAAAERCWHNLEGKEPDLIHNLYALGCRRSSPVRDKFSHALICAFS